MSIIISGSGYKGHASLLANAVAELKSLETAAQSSYLSMTATKKIKGS